MGLRAAAMKIATVMHLVLLAAIAGLTLAVVVGCATPRPPEPVTVVEVERVKVPVLVKPEPPDYLLAPLVDDPPRIFSPATDEDVRWGVTPEGMKAFRLLIETLASRQEQWEAWAADE